MKVRELIKQWQETSPEVLTAREFSVRLPVRDAARLLALAELYPAREVPALITDLIGAALDEIEEALPYVEGSRIISEDDQGDPIYEDAGPTPRFRELTERFSRELHEERSGGAPPRT